MDDHAVGISIVTTNIPRTISAVDSIVSHNVNNINITI